MADRLDAYSLRELLRVYRWDSPQGYLDPLVVALTAEIVHDRAAIARRVAAETRAQVAEEIARHIESADAAHIVDTGQEGHHGYRHAAIIARSHTQEPTDV
jgi:ABC-type arginine transport system ATPase subunit